MERYSLRGGINNAAKIFGRIEDRFNGELVISPQGTIIGLLHERSCLSRSINFIGTLGSGNYKGIAISFVVPPRNKDAVPITYSLTTKDLNDLYAGRYELRRTPHVEILNASVDFELEGNSEVIELNPDFELGDVCEVILTRLE